MVEREAVNFDVAGSSPASPANRYVARLRGVGGFREYDLANLDELAFGDTGTWDAVEKCFVKKNERGEWVPE